MIKRVRLQINIILAMVSLCLLYINHAWLINIFKNIFN